MKTILCSVYMRLYEAFLSVALRLFNFLFLRFNTRAVDENSLQRLYAFLRSVSLRNAEIF
jgi:hypothetical protein